jgi:hypothetical protein
LVPEDLFRLGNAESPRLSHVRQRDVDVVQVGEITVVVANGKGISLFDLEGISLAPVNGWVWRIRASRPVPAGLKLVKDKPHHYSIAPLSNMPLSKYKGLLEEFALHAERFLKKEVRSVR